MIALLGLAIVCLLAWRLHQDGSALQAAGSGASSRISAQARIIELRQAAKALARTHVGGLFPMESLEKLAKGGTPPWDRALFAVLAVEDGDPALGKRLAPEGRFPGGEAFRRCFQAAYLSQGDAPAAEDRAEVRTAFRNGYAWRLLEARLEAPAVAAKLREEAQGWALPRLAGLASAGLALVLLVPAGIVLAILLGFSIKDPRPLPIPEIRLSGRALTLAFLGWFAVFLSSGIVVGTLLASAPVLRPFSLPLIYGFHAATGIALLCQLEGVSLRVLRRRLMPGSHAGSLAWGFGFLAVATVVVLGVSLLLSPILRSQESPQRDLLDLVAHSQGPLPVGLLFLTVAVAAPLFEEVLFRGTLLPWLGHRLERWMGVRLAWTAALLLSSLGFGLIHLQPAALPVLATLGLMLGLAYLHTRNLWTAVLLHGLWNGGVFLFYRVVLG